MIVMTRSEVLKYALDKLIELGWHDIEQIKFEMLTYHANKIDVELTVYLYRGRHKIINLSIFDRVGDILLVEDLHQF